MNITKLLLIGGAAWLGYEYFLAPASTPVVASTPAAGIVPASTPVVASAANPTTTKALVQAAATKGGFTSGNVDQWDYFYAQARGIPAPDPISWGVTDANRGQVLSFDEWWNLASAHGLSGLRGVVPTGRSMARGVGYVPTNRLMVLNME